MKVIGLPDSVTQSVSGSDPSCSLVAPWTSLTAVGKVNGSFSLQDKSPAETVAPVMLFRVLSMIQLMLGLQLSRFIRERNDAASCK